MIYEVLGLIGTLTILVAFLCNTEKNIRLLDMVGAAFFILYGVLTKTWSTMALNIALVGIQIWKLWGIRKKEKG